MEDDGHYWWGWASAGAFGSATVQMAEGHVEAEAPVPTLIDRDNHVTCISFLRALGWIDTILIVREQTAYVFVSHLAKGLASSRLFINICRMELNQRVPAEIYGKWF